jgi:hypothetical protein
VRSRALSADDVNELGLRTGQSERLRTITPYRLFLSTIAGLAGGQVESLADMLREFNRQNDVTVAYMAFYNRLARPGFAKFMRRMFDRLTERLCVQTLAPEGKAAVSRFKNIVIQDGSPVALKKKLRDVFPGDSRRSTRGKIYGADGAAARLGLKPATLQSKMRKLGMRRADFS